MNEDNTQPNNQVIVPSPKGDDDTDVIEPPDHFINSG